MPGAESKLPHIEVRDGQRYFVDPMTKVARPLMRSTRELIAELEQKVAQLELEVAKLKKAAQKNP
jgi:isochorismate hydrolase